MKPLIYILEAGVTFFSSWESWLFDRLLCGCCLKTLCRCYFDELEFVIFGWCQQLSSKLLVGDGSMLSKWVVLGFLVVIDGSHRVSLKVGFTQLEPHEPHFCCLAQAEICTGAACTVLLALQFAES